MKNFLLILFVAALATVGFGQDYKECSDFKYGKFTFPLTPEGSGYAVRENNIQTSYIRNGEKLLVWEVKWIDECHYELTLIEKNDELPWSIGDRIEVEINSFKNNCYGYKAKTYLKNKEKFKGPDEFYDMMCKENEL